MQDPLGPESHGDGRPPLYPHGNLDVYADSIAKPWQFARRPSADSLFSKGSSLDLNPDSWQPAFGRATDTLTQLVTVLRADSEADPDEYQDGVPPVYVQGSQDITPIYRQESQDATPIHVQGRGTETFMLSELPETHEVVPPAPCASALAPSSSASASDIVASKAPPPPISEAAAQDQRNTLYIKLCEMALVAEGQDNNVKLLDFLEELKVYLRQREDDFGYMRSLLQQRDEKLTQLKTALKKRDDKLSHSRKLADQCGEDLSESRNLLMQLAMELVQRQTQNAPAAAKPRYEGSDSFLYTVLLQRDREIAELQAAREQQEARIAELLQQAEFAHSSLAAQQELQELRQKLYDKDRENGQLSAHLEAASRELAVVRDGLRKSATTTGSTTLSKSHDSQGCDDPLDLSQSNVLDLSDEESPNASKDHSSLQA